MVEAISRLDAPMHRPRAVHVGTDLGCKNLAKLHPPLVKGVDAPHHALQCQHMISGLLIREAKKVVLEANAPHHALQYYNVI